MKEQASPRVLTKTCGHAYRRSIVLWCVVTLLAGGHPTSFAQDAELPSPLRLEDVLAYARGHRREIVAAHARARAADQRPSIVSALDDPMIMPSVDHLPFMLHGVDASLMIEQRFPLSRVLTHRRRGAEAEARRLHVDALRVSQDVQLDAARAYLMLRERRELASVLEAQVALAREVVTAASARYAAGGGNASEVVRAEIEVARLEGVIRAIASEVAAAEAMLNASLGRPVDASVPPLAGDVSATTPGRWEDVRATTLRRRPELEVGRAELRRAQAEVAVMESMDAPMAFVRTGPAYTMADRWGWMLMVGVSVPIWREKYGAGVREARAMTAMARAELEAMTTMAEGEAATARHLLLAARERAASLRDEVLPRARHAVELSLGAYAAGTVPLVAVLDAAQTLWSLQAELVLAELELGLAQARLWRVQGAFEESEGR